ncbi:diguanylate cyclase regulator RdcB family protein [Anabaena sp. UHCC 0204]|uniref:diguanylate cyclase regulator RdcB family protein n=1 Tax=Anabaena sp. UHCC 0204 TaxID=2590009 RepID=UPI001447F1FF|nr:diguanylate cyclase regulator RdcB family protein [Anabaena sp. UHCC 0204]MTJ09021.1 hypothetical protein [Anabaena sp. UHCC 0204]
MNEYFQITIDNNVIVDKLIRNHSQLSEKAIVDYINGLEIINDHINVNQWIMNSDSFLNKILDSITGRSQQRQLIINKNIATSLEVISVWLQELDYYRIDNDIVITRLTDKLRETREGVMRLNGRVIEIDNRLGQLNLEFINLKNELNQVKAKNHVDLVFAKWNGELWLNYPPLVSLYLAIDELFWGDFGIYCRNSADSRKVNDLIEYLCNKVLKMIKDEIGINQHKPLLLSELLSPICKLSDEEREMLSYLCDWSDFKTAPVTWSIYSYASDHKPPHVNKEIPIVLHSKRLFYRLIDEQNERVKF